eukprot:TRINITY_DN27602_c0_g1_i1.p1 TRINITY_DN27602_c0_g1~~TRINITY_DN27602_c0_g1_i1.p1  ORF type:complete len:244 (+),score=66.31 TRINITY_DN27602_c0_g1_i1:57-788(+)
MPQEGFMPLGEDPAVASADVAEGGHVMTTVSVSASAPADSSQGAFDGVDAPPVQPEREGGGYTEGSLQPSLRDVQQDTHIVAGLQQGGGGDAAFERSSLGEEDVEWWRRAVLVCCVLLLLASWAVMIGFHAMQHLLGIVACVAMLTVVGSRESVYNPGDARACCNRATRLTVFFVCLTATCLLDVCALIYSRFQKSRGDTDHTPDHFGSYTVFMNTMLISQLITMFAGYRLHLAVQRRIRLPE